MKFVYSPVTRPGLALVSKLQQSLVEVGALTVVHSGQANRHYFVFF